MLNRIFKKSVPATETDAAKNRNCSEFEVDKWNISEFVINKLVPVVGIKPYPLDELMLLASSVCGIKPTHIFEWGTHLGKSARIFYETIAYYNIDAEIHSFDLPDDVDHVEHPHETRGGFVKHISAVKLYQEDGLKKGIEIFNESKRPNKSALFYLDGDHEYDTVIRELTTVLAAIPDVKVLLHDTFYQSDASGYNIGPYKAIVDGLKGREKDFTIIRTSLGLPGMTLLFRK